MMECIILLCKMMGLAIEGKEMELVSFFCHTRFYEQQANKANQLLEERGRDQ